MKEFIESLMKGEIQIFLEETEGSRNGYYERDLGTRYGKINGLRIPRDRNNEFQTALYLKSINAMLVLIDVLPLSLGHL